MNIIRMRQEERQLKIGEIEATLRKVKSKNLELDKNKFLLECISKWSIAKRTAKEYLEIAEFNISKIDKELEEELEILK